MLKFTADQIDILQRLQAIEMGKKIDVRFDSSKPDDDTAAIRRTVYLDGGIDTFKYLLGFDAELERQAEEEKQTRLAASTGTGQQPPTPETETF